MGEADGCSFFNVVKLIFPNNIHAANKDKKILLHIALDDETLKRNLDIFFNLQQ